MEIATIQFDDASGEFAEKGSIVGYYDEGAAVAKKKLLEPLDGFNVKVVGGFV